MTSASFNPAVGLYAHSKDTVGRPIALDKILGQIASGDRGLAALTAKARELYESGDKAAYRVFKGGDAHNLGHLPAFTPCGLFAPGRKDAGWETPSSAGILDYDELGGLEFAVGFKEIVSQHPAVAAAFISPSGDGLKVIVRLEPTPTTPAENIEAWEALSHAFKSLLPGVAIDSTGQNAGRLCFMAHDPDIYINPDPEPLAWDEIIVPPKEPLRRANKVTPGKGNEVPRRPGQGLDPQDWAPDALRYADASAEYPLWRNIGFALKSGEISGELPNAKELFFSWSQAGAGDKNGGWRKDPAELERYWAGFNPRSITLGTLWHTAEDRGWNPEPFFKGGKDRPADGSRRRKDKDVAEPSPVSLAINAMPPHIWDTSADAELQRLTMYRPGFIRVSYHGAESQVLVVDDHGYLNPLETVKQTGIGLVKLAVDDARKAALAAAWESLSEDDKREQVVANIAACYKKDAKHYAEVLHLADAVRYRPEQWNVPVIDPTQLDNRNAYPILPAAPGTTPQRGSWNLVTGQFLTPEQVADCNMLRHGWGGCRPPDFDLLKTADAGNCRLVYSTDPGKSDKEYVDVVGGETTADVMAWFLTHLGVDLFYRIAWLLGGPRPNITVIEGSVSGVGKGSLYEAMKAVLGPGTVIGGLGKKLAPPSTGDSARFTGGMDYLADAVLLILDEMQDYEPAVPANYAPACCESSLTIHRKGVDAKAEVPRVGNAVWLGGGQIPVDFNRQPVSRRVDYLWRIDSGRPAISTATRGRLLTRNALGFLMAWLIQANRHLRNGDTPPPGPYPQGLRVLPDARTEISDWALRDWKEEMAVLFAPKEDGEGGNGKGKRGGHPAPGAPDDPELIVALGRLYDQGCQKDFIPSNDIRQDLYEEGFKEPTRQLFAPFRAAGLNAENGEQRDDSGKVVRGWKYLVRKGAAPAADSPEDLVDKKVEQGVMTEPEKA